jgi:hypothetical protein
VIPSLDVLIYQARRLSSPKMADLGEAQGSEAIEDGWIAPDHVLEMDPEDLISAWNTHVQGSKHA